MARLDAEALGIWKQIRQDQRVYSKKTLFRYHELVCIYQNFLYSPQLKEQFVRDNPMIAAEIFYHFNDSAIGGSIVAAYSSHKDAMLREIAHFVRGVLDVRAKSANKLENVLGMKSVVTRLPDRDDYNSIGAIDNVERAFDAV